MTTAPQRHPAQPPIDDAQLMAYVDGVLQPAQARAVADAVAQDPALAARAEGLRRARSLAREALEAPEALAVPMALRDTVQAMVAAQAALRARAAEAPAAAAQAADAAPPTVDGAARAPAQGFPSARPPRPAASGWWRRLREGVSALTLPMAVACSVFFGVVGFQLGRIPAGEATLALAVGQSASPALAALLDRLPSGAQGDAAGTPVALVASFRDAAGALCRDFSVEAAQAPRMEAVACRHAPGAGAAGWELRYAAAVPADTGGYAPAGASAALDSYLGSIGAREPLDAQAEQAALEAPAKP